jgi:hypothetical protein
MKTCVDKEEVPGDHQASQGCRDKVHIGEAQVQRPHQDLTKRKQKISHSEMNINAPQILIETKLTSAQVKKVYL